MYCYVLSCITLYCLPTRRYCANAVSLFYGAHRVAAGKLNGGQVVCVQMATMLASFSLGQGASALQHIARGRVAGARLFKTIHRLPGMLDVARGSSGASGLPPKAADGSGKDVVQGGGQGGKGQQLAVASAGVTAVIEMPGSTVNAAVVVRGEVELRDVHFNYPIAPDRVVFR